MDVKRVFLIVLDSFGAGEAPDAAAFGDTGSNTLRSVSSSPEFYAPNLTRLGLFSIEGTGCEKPDVKPRGVYGKCREVSAGKDTVTGHWEISGVISDKPMPTYPDGFPESVLAQIEKATGIGTLCNKPYSGTEVIKAYGREQAETGKMIVYTSADSVYQAAAHTDVIPLDKLYAYCRTARRILSGKNAVGRVIARPFVGEYPDYQRTSDRHDFALEPTGTTMLDVLKAAGLETVSIGKISDIFAGRGVTERIPTVSNADGMKKTDAVSERDFNGLCFVNLVDFDSKYGHRNDVSGYARAISEFDLWLGDFMKKLLDDDLLMITADHGCDPATPSTDHSREYIPLLVYANGLIPKNIGTRSTYADIGKTILSLFRLDNTLPGEDFSRDLVTVPYGSLMSTAREAMKCSYSPYSRFAVGAALLCRDGKVFTGCNVESAAFSPTVCAERTALVKAVSEGEREFLAIAVAGGKNGVINGVCTPCGVCRQFLSELCGDIDVVLSGEDGKFTIKRLSELLPDSFGEASFIGDGGEKNDS